MRDVTVAAVQVAPDHRPLSVETVAGNTERALDWVERAVEATGAELVVLPETVTTGFGPAMGPDDLWDLLQAAPGAGTAPYTELAQRLGIHLVWGAYEPGEQRGVVYNAAHLAGPDGTVLGTYHKTHPFCSEDVNRGGWVTPGEHVTVVETEIGTIGLIICFDGDYPELSRINAVKGAEIIARPSALLRSADLWELTTRARAYDNHVYVVGTNATGLDPAGSPYFGNSMIVTPIAEVVARAASHECWVSARLTPATAMASLTPGSSVPQRWDHLDERNLALLANYAEELAGPARTPFPHAAHEPPPSSTTGA
ncbi:carbon-nitrogen hydrolase family protein [Nocardioides sp. ChNu-153]|uniref:carbon-nitrogen hydrolase family protein n=1 Tax=unclassified Nocardioides TaxID=2615069 RepID=UPI002405122F|nr:MULTISPECIES: carbon-nitrogen hydrolase family protein [unclassified Nocardioides]MDF9714622.1 carbon-nitrogen hydrolase family protein [Nocardioides sp. ChNu-99]MDN7119844.1 carbon-nitrogen hydrolase family protein [Nocardioides sp. ChNu-153]